jgi:parallel beta-helix repeat protein
VVLVHPGKYRTHLTITKRIDLVGVGSTRPVIDAGCLANDTIKVTSPGVKISGLTVKGADVVSSQEDYPAEVYFEGVASGKATDLRTVDSCDAEYGISAFSTGPVKVTDNFGSGFEDSAIYIGSIADTRGRTLLVEGNTSVHNSRGIIVEDSPADTDITVRANTLSDNTIAGSEGPSDGLFLHNSDGVLIAGNRADDNGASGFHADPNSDHNLFRDNTASGNGQAAFSDDNGDNCGSGNDFDLLAHCS